MLLSRFKATGEAHYNIGKYGLMRWEYLQTNSRREYLLDYSQENGHNFVYFFGERKFSAAPSITFLSHLGSEVQGNCAVFWSYNSLLCIQRQMYKVPEGCDSFSGWFLPFLSI